MHITEQIREYVDRAILYSYRGSHTHGTYIPSTDPNSIDDIDMMGVYLAAPERYVGLQENLQRSFPLKHEEYDYEFHEFRRFLNLLLKSNPNVIGMLWLQPHLYKKISETGRYLIDHRDIFSSKAAYYSFTGYAHAQLYKMEHLAYQGYMGAKRKRLVEKYGYDTKNAAHCIRLLRMGIEFLLTGEIHVWRADADTLKEIKTGLWTLDQVKDEASRLFKNAEEALLKTHLPHSPDKEKAERLCMDVLTDYLRTGIVK